MTLLPLESPSGNKVYIGPRPDLDAKTFDALNIKTAIVFLSEEELAAKPINPFYTERKVNQILFPIPESGTPPSIEAVHKLFSETLLKALESGNVYMHCKLGKGRTGLMVSCGIMLKQQVDSKAAVGIAKGFIPALDLSLSQILFLTKFQQAYVKSAAGPSGASSAVAPKEMPSAFALSPSPASMASASSAANPFAKHLLPFKSKAGFELYAGPCPKLMPSLANHPEKTFKTVAILLSEGECAALGIKAYYDSRGIKQIYLPIADSGVPASVEKGREFIEQIFKALEEGNLYLHCKLGRGRTGLVMTCIAILKKALTAEEAFAFTKKYIVDVALSGAQIEYYNKFHTAYGSQEDSKEKPSTSAGPAGKPLTVAVVPDVAPSAQSSALAVAPDLPPVPLLVSPANAGPAAVVTPPKPKAPSFAKNVLPFETPAEFKLHAGTCPTVYPKKELKPLFKTVAAIVTEDEAAALGLKDYYTSIGIEQMYFPISDQGVPESAAKTLAFIEQLYAAVETGHVYMHSCGTADRTGLIIACMAIVKKGMTGDEALVYTRSLVPKVMTKSPAQEQFVRDFYEQFNKKQEDPSEQS